MVLLELMKLVAQNLCHLGAPLAGVQHGFLSNQYCIVLGGEEGHTNRVAPELKRHEYRVIRASQYTFYTQLRSWLMIFITIKASTRKSKATLR